VTYSVSFFTVVAVTTLSPCQIVRALQCEVYLLLVRLSFVVSLSILISVAVGTAVVVQPLPFVT
jgi:hypothetical protein